MSRAIYEDDVIKLLDKKWKLGQYPLPRDVRALTSAEPKIIRCRECKYVDADALIEFIENRYEITWASGTYEGGIKDACSDILEKIDNMENIKPETNSSESPNGWIPCTKKKHPDKDMFCHVTVIDDDGDYIVDDDDWDVDSESWDEYSDDEIIAWMPEIQPYQPKEDES